MLTLPVSTLTSATRNVRALDPPDLQSGCSDKLSQDNAPKKKPSYEDSLWRIRESNADATGQHPDFRYAERQGP